jgi:hypothetical protein
MNKEQLAVLLISLVFATLASGTAFLIAFGEYVHHFPHKRQAAKEALEPAIVAFVIFFGLGLILGYVLPSVFG